MLVTFQAYGRTLETVSAFKYLGRVIAALDEDWPTVVANLRKLLRQWVSISMILGWEVSDPGHPGTFIRRCSSQTSCLA